MAASHTLSVSETQFQDHLIISKTIWPIDWKLLSGLVPVGGFVLSNFAPIGNPIWPPGRHLWFFLYLYLQNYLSNEVEIWIIDWYPSADLSCGISSQSETKYGRQAAILDFFRELYLKNHLSNQFEILIIDWYPSEDLCCQMSSQPEIQHGCHLIFSFRYYISRTIWAISLKFRS